MIDIFDKPSGILLSSTVNKCPQPEGKAENVDASQSTEENPNADEAVVDAKSESESISEDVAESAEPEKEVTEPEKDK